ncbi:MAG: hypothetical protein K1W24_07535 [Lachnospiraceae bacterium]
MFKLIKLEWKKNNTVKYMRNALILALILCIFIFALAFLGIANDPDGTLDAVEGNDKISASIELFTSISFLLVLFTQGSIGDYSLAGNTIVPVVLTAVSFIAAGLSVWNVETKDLM